MKTVNSVLHGLNRHDPALIVILFTAVGLLLSPIQTYAVNVDIWISADDRFDLYSGTGAATTSFVGGFAGWSVPNNYTPNVPYGDYLYVVAADIGAAVWGVGGYLSEDGGANYTPIVVGTGWEAALVGFNQPWPAQATVDSWIATANSNNDWVLPVPSSASPGFGLPTDYGSVTRPALGSIWEPTGVAQPFSTVLLRRRVVPEPASAVVLMIGLGVAMLWLPARAGR
jgi:hypothetical protein